MRNEAGFRAARTFWIKHDGTLELRADSAQTTHTKAIAGYVTNNMGGRATVIVNRDGSISVSHEDA